MNIKGIDARDPDTKKFLEKPDKEILKQPKPEIFDSRKDDILPIPLGDLIDFPSLELKLDIGNEIVLYVDLYWMDILNESEIYINHYRGDRIESNYNFELSDNIKKKYLEIFIHIKRFDREKEKNLDAAFKLIRDYLKEKFFNKLEKSVVIEQGNYIDYYTLEIMLVFVLLNSKEGEKKGKQRFELLLSNFEKFRKSNDSISITDTYGDTDVYKIFEENLNVLSIMAQKYSFPENEEEKKGDPYYISNVISKNCSQPIDKTDLENCLIYRQLNEISIAICLVEEEEFLNVVPDLMEWLCNTRTPPSGSKDKPKSLIDNYVDCDYFGTLNNDSINSSEFSINEKKSRIYMTLIMKLVTQILKKLCDYLNNRFIKSKCRDIKGFKSKYNEIFGYRDTFFEKVLKKKTKDISTTDLDSFYFLLANYYISFIGCFEHGFATLNKDIFLSRITFTHFREIINIYPYLLSSYVIKKFKLIISFIRLGHEVNKDSCCLLKETVESQNLAHPKNQSMIRHKILIDIILNDKCLTEKVYYQDYIQKITNQAIDNEVWNSDVETNIDKLKEFFEILIDVFKLRNDFLKKIIEQIENFLEKSEKAASAASQKLFCNKRKKRFTDLLAMLK